MEYNLQETGDRYRIILQSLGEGVWEWDCVDNVAIVSPQFLVMLGYAPDADAKTSCQDFLVGIHPDDVARFQAAKQQHLTDRLPFDVEFRVQHRAGHYIWLRSRGQAMWDAQGQPLWMAGAVEEITARKANEAALQQQAQREQAFNEVVQAIRSLLDLEAIFRLSAAKIAELLQGGVSIVRYLPERRCWKHLVNYSHGSGYIDDLEREIADLDNPFAAQLKQQQVVRIDNTETIRDAANQELAEQAPGAWLLVPIVVEGVVWGSLSLARAACPDPWPADDIELAQRIADQLAIAIQQANLHQQLQAAHERNELVLQSVGEGVWDLDLTTDSMTVSARYRKIFGYEADAAIPISFPARLERLHSDDHERVLAAWQQHLETNCPYDVELRTKHREGHYIWLRERGQAIRDARGQPVRAVGTIEDISQRRQEQELLSQRERLLDLFFRNPWMAASL
ncbi:MAG: PAS domain-containing protein [Spirulinaceae cyanobacterium RM2_2_10]|nr:PAS domain-containing protein [Spirulinaceae cyanobacterium RM2_2_10]